MRGEGSGGGIECGLSRVMQWFGFFISFQRCWFGWTEKTCHDLHPM